MAAASGRFDASETRFASTPIFTRRQAFSPISLHYRAAAEPPARQRYARQLPCRYDAAICAFAFIRGVAAAFDAVTAWR
jgi:hypothetical protein